MALQSQLQSSPESHDDPGLDAARAADPQYFLGFLAAPRGWTPLECGLGGSVAAGNGGGAPEQERENALTGGALSPKHSGGSLGENEIYSTVGATSLLHSL